MPPRHPRWFPLLPAALAPLLASAPAPAAAEGFREALVSVLGEAREVAVLAGEDEEDAPRLTRVGGSAAFRGAGSNNESQVWVMDPLDGGTFAFRDLGEDPSSLAAPAPGGGGGGGGGPVVLTRDADDPAARWRVEWAGEGAVRLRTAGGDGGGGLLTPGGDRATLTPAADAGGEARLLVKRLVSVGSPTITRTPDGTLYAYFYRRGKVPGRENVGEFHRSVDNGATWELRSELPPFYGPSLFVHGGVPSLIYGHHAELQLRQTRDGGATWETHTFATLDGESIESGGGGPVLVARGHLHFGFMDKSGGRKRGWPGLYRLRVASAPVDADLTDPASWTVSEPIAFPEDPARRGTRGGWLEPNLVEGPDGRVWLVARVDHLTEGNVAAVLKLSDDRTRIEFENRHPAPGDQTGFIDAAWAGSSNFYIEKDPLRGFYWVMCNPHWTTPPAAERHRYVRNRLSLYATRDLKNYVKVEDLVEDDLFDDPVVSTWMTGFQQPSFVLDGGVMHYVLRTGYGTFDNYHDANLITYHRVDALPEVDFDAPAD